MKESSRRNKNNSIKTARDGTFAWDNWMESSVEKEEAKENVEKNE